MQALQWSDDNVGILCEWTTGAGGLWVLIFVSSACAFGNEILQRARRI